MLKILQTDNAVVAISISGKITVEDVDQSYDLLVDKLKDGAKINVFIELCDGFDLNSAAIIRDFQRAGEILKKRKQFDRIALVTDESWIRALARVEEFALYFSGVDLQLFDASERDYALAWAKGEVDEHHDASIRLVDSEDPNIVVFEIVGKMRKADMKIGKQLMENFVDDNPPGCLMAKLTDYRGFEVSLLADRELIALKRKTMNHLDRYALVGAPDWMENIAREFGALMKFEIKTFEDGEEAEAMEWLQESVMA